MSNQEIALQIFSKIKDAPLNGEKLVIEYIKILDALDERTLLKKKEWEERNRLEQEKKDRAKN